MSITSEAIKRRTVLFTIINGVLIFPGWARVETGLGTAFEPFNMGWCHAPNSAIDDVDPSDPVARIDLIEGMDPIMVDVVHRDQGNRVHGGTMIPRVFRKGGDILG